MFRELAKTKLYYYVVYFFSRHG